MKKNEQKIKKEEKEEKNLRRLISAESDYSQPPQRLSSLIPLDEIREGEAHFVEESNN